MRLTDRNSAGRTVPVVSLVGSTVLHASLAAAFIYGALGTAVRPPEPIVVELVPGVGAGPAGDSATGGQQGSATGAGETLPEVAQSPSVAAPESIQRSPTESTKEPGRPASRPRSVAKRPRSEPKKVPPMHQHPPALAAEPATPTGDAVSLSGRSTQPFAPLAASLGTGGAATAVSGGAGRPGGRHGSETGDGGSAPGPGFSLGSAGNPMPSYPPAARRRGIEGKVVLDVLVSAEGRALSVAIARSSGSSLLDEAARETVGRWRFRPAMREDEAIQARATVPVQFSLIEP